MSLWKISLSNGKGWATVDVEDYLNLYRYNWFLSEDQYAVRHLDRNRTQRMHRDVMGLTKEDDEIVDHINGDRLDNRRLNLRLTTIKENNQNMPSRGGTSEFKGVRYRERNGLSWEASGSIGGEKVSIGYYDHEWQAAVAARNFRREHYEGYSDEREFNTAWFYVLIDPRTGDIRYLGKSVDPEDRYVHHCKPSERAKDTWKAKWLRELMDGAGEAPALFIIEEVPESIWEEREEWWIENLRAAGAPLTNQQVGGIGQSEGLLRRDDVREKLRPNMAGKSRGGSSKFPGVSYHKSKGKWCAFITIRGENKYVGQYDSEEAAAKAAYKARCDEYDYDYGEDEFLEIWEEFVRCRERQG